MSKLAHSNQATMDEIEARQRDQDDEVFNMDDEATQFAAYLLIPEEILARELAKIKRPDIDDTDWLDALCKKFRVTRGLMQYRLTLRGKS